MTCQKKAGATRRTGSGTYVAAMQPLVYIETSIISYLAARPSRELVTAAHQQLTADWWSSARPAFRVGISELVIQEASLGDSQSARRRLELLTELSVLRLTQSGRELARALIERVLQGRGYTPPILCTPEELMNV